MTALFIAVFTASLLGSLHCAGMCGAFVVLAVSQDAGAATRPWKLQAAYHGGRLVTYAAFGLVAGALGASLNFGGSLIDVQRAATILASATLLFFGVMTLLRVLGVRKGARVSPAWMTRLAQRGHRAAWTLDPAPRALVIGLLTTLLPCGWLYAFVVTAAGTGHALAGAAVMGAFWLGTLPVMATVGAGARRLAGPLGAHAPLLTSCLLIAVGLFTLVHRASLIGLALPSLPAASVSAQQTALSVPDPSEPPACCRGH